MKRHLKTGALLPALLVGAISIATLISSSQQTYAKDLPPQATYQAMLDYSKKSGWIALKNNGNEQFIYFSHLQTLHCRLKEIRYSINTTELDKRFNLVKCVKALPYSLPSNSKISDILVRVPIGTAQTVAVQVVWEDGRESDIAIYKPCEGVGDRVCAELVE